MFFGEDSIQYIMVVGAILLLLLIKMLVVRNRVNKQYDDFVHPDLCIEEVKSRVGSP